MKPIETALTSTNGYVKSLNRNTIEGQWELEIGLPISWVYDENKDIGCEVTFENDDGRLIRIFPKKKNTVADDLFDFVEIIIETNERIAEKEMEFTSKMKEMKGLLEDEAKKFYQELEELKESSFKKIKPKELVETESKVDKPSPKPKATPKPTLKTSLRKNDGDGKIESTILKQ